MNTIITARILGGLALLGALAPAQEHAGDTAAFPPASPESVGLSSEALARLSETVAEYVERDVLVGGELLVIKDRRTVLHEVYGHADRAKERPWTKGTVCNIRSMTKPLTGAAAQILFDRGEMSPEDPAAEYLPGFDTDAARGIRVEEILAHRAGLPLTILGSLDEHATLIDMGNAVGARGPEYEPGSRFWYSDSGTDALGAIVEVVSGERIDEFVGRELLSPLGMSESFYFYDDEDPRRERIASLYVGGPGHWERYADPEEDAFYPYAWGSQSLYSTPMDYARFLAMWMDGGLVGERRLLSEAAIERTLRPQSEMTMLGSDARAPTSFKGLEVYYGEMAVLHVPEGSQGAQPAVIVGHSGSDGTIAWGWPERDLMILFFTQSRGSLAVLRLEEAIDRLLIAPEAYAAEEPVPEELRPFLGVYVADWANHMLEEFTVHVKDGALAIDVPSQLDFVLAPAEAEGRWTFAIAPAIGVWFERDETGAVDCLRIEQGPIVFEAPRKGTPHATEYLESIRDTEETVGRYLGTYEDPELEGDAEVLVDGRYLAIRAADGKLFHLWKVPVADLWTVREAPMVQITFEEEEGAVVSFTRHTPGGTKMVHARKE